ncbi:MULTISPECIES: [FeFe] hydrogenase H-cluster maturation GTPase HydF [Blautia]|uniref:[FeFe] hydrogenase H-cluster maturation GTPase HydF n=1 Tax=Blautia TaxID=572511 RepID=UPI000BA37D8A|nr:MULTISPECIES: [FeFe] hydrogenase H-cluster maturation GTPase HydF [Blautia]
MSLNAAPSANRVHISFFGRRNTGKSSLLNAVTGQDMAVVSDVKGTTTDPVQKAMELLPIGPVLLIDTPGMDDDQEGLGILRVKKAEQVLHKTDVAVLVAEAGKELTSMERQLIELFEKRGLPYLLVYNKMDLLSEEKIPETDHEIYVSAQKGIHIFELKEKLGSLAGEGQEHPLVKDLVSPGDFVLLVIPIDKAAPKGRLILPQQQVIRELLDTGAVPLAVQDDRVEDVLGRLGEKPRLVITDSQVFGKVSRAVPAAIPLTSFSILFARYKGILDGALKGAYTLDDLKDQDKVLISEGCTHHRQCNDIGTVKMPRWIETHTGKKPEFVFTSGTGFPEDLTPYRLVVHCGGCMLNEREMQWRRNQAVSQGVPMTNYGIAIAHMNGILQRSLEIFRR